MQKVIIKMKRAFQNKKRTCFNKTCYFNKVLPNLYTGTLLYQRCSEAVVRDVLRYRCP